MRIVDRLIETIKGCDYYVAILADDRRGHNDHGTPIKFEDRDTAVTFFEIELYAAAMLRKVPKLFILEGFDPGPRLQQLLKILSWAYPDWRRLKPQNAGEILKSISKIISKEIPHTSEWLPDLVKSLYLDRIEPIWRFGRRPKTLFFDGIFEDSPLPDIERVKSLIQEYRATSNFQQKATRLWLAARELMRASYMPRDVQVNSQLREFLPYWNCVLADWAGVASWQGWHGHLHAGTIAPLNSQAIVQGQLSGNVGGFPPEITLPPDGALASAYYNVAKITGMPFAIRPLMRAGRYVKRAIGTRTGPKDNLLAIRGSIRLRLGNWFGAVADFQDMCDFRERSGSSPQKMADAYMHLGQAYSFLSFSRKAEDLLTKAVTILESFPDDPNLPRCRGKLANLYDRLGRKGAAEECRQKLITDVNRQGSVDQLPTTRL